MLARESQFAVRVVLPHVPERRVMRAEAAAERAGVDVVIKWTAASATVHFITRHQDRRLAPSAVMPEPLCSLSWFAPFDRRPANSARNPRRPTGTAPRPVDVVAFRQASDALALDQADDGEGALIWDCLLRAGTRAHMCAGIPMLLVNDIGGLVWLLRRRAERQGVVVRVNPDACACG
jgi:hypothetical protein